MRFNFYETYSNGGGSASEKKTWLFFTCTASPMRFNFYETYSNGLRLILVSSECKIKALSIASPDKKKHFGALSGNCMSARNVPSYFPALQTAKEGRMVIPPDNKEGGRRVNVHASMERRAKKASLRVASCMIHRKPNRATKRRHIT